MGVMVKFVLAFLGFWSVLLSAVVIVAEPEAGTGDKEVVRKLGGAVKSLPGVGAGAKGDPNMRLKSADPGTEAVGKIYRACAACMPYGDTDRLWDSPRTIQQRLEEDLPEDSEASSSDEDAQGTTN